MERTFREFKRNIKKISKQKSVKVTLTLELYEIIGRVAKNNKKSRSQVCRSVIKSYFKELEND